MQPFPTSQALPPEPEFPPDTRPTLALWRDPVLLGAFLFVGLLAGFQVALHLLHVPWLSVVTDWLLAVLAWPELLVLVLLSWWLRSTHRLGALTWWLLSAAFLCHALAQTFRLVGDQVLGPFGPSYPWWSDLFFLLQAPFVYLALLVLPSAIDQSLRGLARMRVFLDSLLVVGALLLLSWYVLSVPLSPPGWPSIANRFAALAYASGAVGILVILIILFTNVRRSQTERAVLGIWIVAMLLVLTGHLWFAALNQPPHHASDIPPEVFWMLGHVLVPVAALVQFRQTRHTCALPVERPVPPSLLWQDILGGLRFFLPLVIAWLTSAALLLQAILAPDVGGNPLLSWGGSLGLLALLLWRQGVVYLENTQLRREREEAQTQERAVREAHRQLETFLGIACHELKTPVTSIMMGLQILHRRIEGSRFPSARKRSETASPGEGVPALTETLLQQADRLCRLVNDLLETFSIQVGQRDLQKKLVDLGDLVRTSVEEQQQMNPERIILLHQPQGEAMPVWADAERIGQVVNNYLTNALKYSGEERPVEVGVQRKADQARVWVQDAGPGIPLAEQAQMWKRFHRVPGIEVQSGSGIGLGVGLHLCQTIIERHGGQVGVESAPGAGSRFWFTLMLNHSEGPGGIST